MSGVIGLDLKDLCIMYKCKLCRKESSISILTIVSESGDNIAVDIICKKCNSRMWPDRAEYDYHS